MSVHENLLNDNFTKMIVKIPQTYYFDFKENDFVQSSETNHIESVDMFLKFNFDLQKLLNSSINHDTSSQKEKVEKPTPKELITKVDPKKDIHFACLGYVFMCFIDPLSCHQLKSSYMNFVDNFKTNLDSKCQLLKVLSNRHKQLRKKIELYLEYDTSVPDVSYLDKEYLLFWASFLNCNIRLVLNNEFYTTYDSIFDTSRYLTILQIKNMEGKNIFYMKDDIWFTENKKKLKMYLDSKELSSLDILSLRKLCIENKLPIKDNNRNISKIDLIKQLNKIFKL